MPVVLRIGPYTFFFYSLENNEPQHIHIRRDYTQAKFWLEPVSLAYKEATRYTRSGTLDGLSRSIGNCC